MQNILKWLHECCFQMEMVMLQVLNCCMADLAQCSGTKCPFVA